MIFWNVVFHILNFVSLMVCPNFFESKVDASKLRKVEKQKSNTTAHLDYIKFLSRTAFNNY